MTLEEVKQKMFDEIDHDFHHMELKNENEKLKQRIERLERLIMQVYANKLNIHGVNVVFEGD